jgi:hypothetical protein
LKAADIASSPAVIDLQILSFNPSQISQPALQCRDAAWCFRVIVSYVHKHPDATHRRLPRERRERPSGCCSCDYFDEIASPHCLAQTRTDGDMQRRNYSRDLQPAKWGSEVMLHGNNPKPRMPALGHKGHRITSNQCPLYPQKRTSIISQSENVDPFVSIRVSTAIAGTCGTVHRADPRLVCGGAVKHLRGGPATGRL